MRIGSASLAIGINAIEPHDNICSTTVKIDINHFKAMSNVRLLISHHKKCLSISTRLPINR
ncbi:hypothetical protein HanIR_Chr01g0038171 [Helianthus annuus]|nr:hypothetical protein HanIR_Chr01g0038171 [Helianthus annuus]